MSETTMELVPGAWYVFRCNAEDGTELPIDASTLIGATFDRHEAARFGREHHISVWQHDETGEVRRLSGQDLTLSHQGDDLGRWLDGAQALGYGAQVCELYCDASWGPHRV